MKENMSNAIRWSQSALDEYRRRLDGPGKPIVAAAPPNRAKRSKYSSTKVDQDGITFDSKKEARRWADLERLQAAGQISELRRQVPFVLAPSVRLIGEQRAKPALRYFADSTYVRDGMLVIEDVKSPPTRKTAIYRAKRHLMKSVLALDITEV